MTTAHRDIGLGIATLLIACVGAFILIPKGIEIPGHLDNAALSPAFWPRAVITIMGLAGLVILLQGLFGFTRGGAQSLPDSAETDPTEAMRPFWSGTARMIVVIVLLIALYLSIPHTGILLATAVILLFLIWFGGERRWSFMVPVAIVLPAALYLFFVKVAQIPLPNGVFEALR